MFEAIVCGRASRNACRQRSIGEILRQIGYGVPSRSKVAKAAELDLLRVVGGL